VSGGVDRIGFFSGRGSEGILSVGECWDTIGAREHHERTLKNGHRPQWASLREKRDVEGNSSPATTSPPHNEYEAGSHRADDPRPKRYTRVRG